MQEKTIKCVVWDLDNTLWDGILAEDINVSLKPGVKEIIEELDNRGILQSIASKNDYKSAMDMLEKFGIDKFFLYPQINWNAKSDGIQIIREKLNFGIDTFAFIDDQEFERQEVSFSIPEVMCIDSVDTPSILKLPCMNPKYVTSDSKNRRLLYMSDQKRNEFEEEYSGTKEEFLKTLNIEFKISRADTEDLKRVEELTVRTHQLNSTGTVYSYDELEELIHSSDYLVLVAEMKDKFGTYGKIGISVVEKKENRWDVKLLLMSCRVMSKGVGTVMLRYIMKLAKQEGVKLYADFIPTDRNRIMYITYKFEGFNENSEKNGVVLLEADLNRDIEYPIYVSVIE